MTIERAVFLYATIFCVLLVPLIWLLIKRIAEKKAKKATLAGNAENAPTQPARKPIDWSALLALRPHAVLSGEMWLKSLIAAFVALCVGVIIVVFIFPLGALWAASAVFVAVIVIVSLMFMLMDSEP